MSAPQKFTVQVLGGQTRPGDRNCHLLDYNDHFLAIDAGGTVTDSGFSFLNLTDEQVQKFRRIVFSHAHLDHTGSLEEILRLLRQPVNILSSRWTNLSVAARLDQFPGLTKYAHFIEAQLPQFDPNHQTQHSGWYQWGPEGVVVALPQSYHSTPESRFVVTYIPNLGAFVWLIDMADPDGPEHEEYLIKTSQHIANLGVTAVFIDSTAAGQDNHRSASEALVRSTLREEIAQALNTLYLTCFAPDIDRIALVVDILNEIRPDSLIYIAGQSLRNNIALACNNQRPDGQPYLHGSAHYDKHLGRWWVDSLGGHKTVSLAEAAEVSDNNPGKLFVFIAGPQADLFDDNAYVDSIHSFGSNTNMIPAALTRWATYGLRPYQSQRALRPKAGDVLIFSSSVIPGNEERIASLKVSLVNKGVKIVDESTSPVHLHGHGDMSKYLLHLNPNFVIPIHGDHQKRELMGQAAQTVLPGVQILQVEDSQQIDFTLDEFGQVIVQVQDIAGISKPEALETRVRWFGTHLTVVDVEVRDGYVYRLVRSPDFDRSVKDEYGLSDTMERLVLGYLNQITENGVPRTKITPGALQRDIREMLLVVLKDQIQLPSVFYPFVKIHDVTDLLAGSATEQVSP